MSDSELRIELLIVVRPSDHQILCFIEDFQSKLGIFFLRRSGKLEQKPDAFLFRTHTRDGLPDLL